MHQYTCLAAPEHLVAAGFSIIVALEADRIPLAAFKSGEDASAWCDKMNGLATNPVADTLPGGTSISQQVAAVVARTAK